MVFKIHAVAKVLVTCISASFFVGSALAQDETSPPPRPAKLIDIVAQDPFFSINLPTLIEPSDTTELTMQIGGILEELPVLEGQLVKTGDLIARIESITLKNDVEQARSQASIAQVEFERGEVLVVQQTISQANYDQRKAQRDITALALEAAQKRLDDAVLKAPFDGVVSAVHVRQFQTVSAQEPVITLHGRENFEAIANIPAQTISNYANAEFLEIDVLLDVAPLTPIRAEFKSIATQADAASQTFEARFSFKPPEGLVVLPGMTGELTAKAKISEDRVESLPIQVPLEAVLFDGTETFVWVVDTETMSVSRRSIELRQSIGEMLDVKSGLEIGDTIVGAGTSYLHDGMIIRRFEG